MLDRLAANLRQLTPNQLEQFQTHFDEIQVSAYAWEPWGAVYIAEGGCSDDGSPTSARG